MRKEALGDRWDRGGGRACPLHRIEVLQSETRRTLLFRVNRSQITTKDYTIVCVGDETAQSQYIK